MIREDLPELLATYLQAAQTKKFVWGEHDCCLFAANFILSVTGEDPAVGFRNHYSTEIGSKRILKKHGLEDLMALLDSKFPRILLTQAKRGDVVLADLEMGQTVGLSAGVNSFFVSVEGGLTSRKTSSCLAAWRVF